MDTRTSTTRRTRSAQVGSNRAAVLAAALDVFRARGYTAATLDQIADAAGFSKGVVYSQFDSKADLFLHVLDQRIDERAAQNALAVEVTNGRDLEAVIEALVALMSRSDPAWRLAVTEFRIAATRDSALLARYDATHRRTVERLAATFDRIYANARRTPPVSTQHLASTILALDVGVVVEDASTTHAIPNDALTLLIRRMVFGK
jgi:AcrR family transcriptional regulator